MTHIWTARLRDSVQSVCVSVRLCVSLSCRPICSTSAGLSDIWGNRLLVRFPDTDDGITTHINETLSLVLVWIFHEHTLLHAVGHYGVATQGCYVGSNHRKHLCYE